MYATCPDIITDERGIEAAKALADQVSPIFQERGRLFPPQSDILEVSITSATRIAEYIFDKGAATVERPQDIRAWIESLTYSPRYID